MNEIIIEKLRSELINDSSLNFKNTGNELRNGVCPNCGERELFINLDKPFVLKCRRLNNCNYSCSTREFYPHIFKNLSEMFPSSEQNPNATADAYLFYNRGFSEDLLKNIYRQGWKKHGKDFFPTVEFPLWEGKSWSRLINDLDIEKNGGKKADFAFGAKYAGKAWCPVPAGQNENGSCENYINNDDVIYITEGIFKSLALISAGKKSISVLSVYNFPSDIFEANKTKKVKWIWAGDNDETVQNTLTKHIEKAKVAGIKIEVILPPAGKDWDDCFRAGYFEPKKIEDFFLLSKWRGMDALAKTVQEKAVLEFLNGYLRKNVFYFKNRTYSYSIKESSDALDKIRMGDIMHQNLAILVQKFIECVEIIKISNCSTDFLYAEKIENKEELQYTFCVSSQVNGIAVRALPSSALETPANFNAKLLNVFVGADFDGSKLDFKIMKEKWFLKKVKVIRSVETIGYDKESQAYIFKNFGFVDGRLIVPNKEAFFEVKKDVTVKSISSIDFAKPQITKENLWLVDFINAFGENGLILLSWWIGSLFACQIRAKHEFFPFMEFTGDQGAGKTTVIEFIWKLCGRKQFEGFDPSKASIAGRYRTMQQVSNLPVVFIEGDRNDGSPDAKCKSFDMDELKTAYNGRPIRSIGVAKSGSSTDSPDFNGAVLISQNATVNGSEAFLSRIVHCHCTKQHFTIEGEKSAKRLHALSMKEINNFLFLILSKEKIFLEKFSEIYNKIVSEKLEKMNIQNRIIHNHAMVDSILHLLPDFFGKEFFQNNIIFQTSTHLWSRAIDRQQRLSADHPLVEQFWDQYEYLNRVTSTIVDGVTKAEEKLNFSNNPETEIAVNLNYFQELARGRGQEIINLKDLKKVLITSTRYKFKKANHMTFSSKNGSNRCWIFCKQSSTRKK